MTAAAFAFREYAAGQEKIDMYINQLPAMLDVYANGMLAAVFTAELEKHEQSKWTVPETVDKEKKSPVVDKDSLRGLAPDFNRGEAVFERNTLKIVEINVF